MKRILPLLLLTAACGSTRPDPRTPDTQVNKIPKTIGNGDSQAVIRAPAGTKPFLQQLLPLSDMTSLNIEKVSTLAPIMILGVMSSPLKFITDEQYRSSPCLGNGSPMASFKSTNTRLVWAYMGDTSNCEGESPDAETYPNGKTASTYQFYGMQNCDDGDYPEISDLAAVSNIDTRCKRDGSIMFQEEKVATTTYRRDDVKFRETTVSQRSLSSQTNEPCVIAALLNGNHRFKNSCSIRIKVKTEGSNKDEALYIMFDISQLQWRRDDDGVFFEQNQISIKMNDWQGSVKIDEFGNLTEYSMTRATETVGGNISSLLSIP